MIDRLEETIVAISSAPGHSPVGIVRLSGPRAISIAERFARLRSRKRLAELAGHTRADGEIAIDKTLEVPAVFYLFRGPRSYTRQDLVEFHTVGSPVVLELARRAALAQGALAAMPGEFTARAFLNGAMNLAKAEAVAGAIRAQTDTQLRANRWMSEGFLAERIGHRRDDLAEVLALVEAEIDFAEEPIEFITPAALRDRVQGIRGGVTQLLRGSRIAERLDVLPHVLLFGAPNAGKSSLMNRLSGTKRSICAAAAGTTRDILSAPIRLGRGEAILLDTAGVDRSDDEIIAEACTRTMSAAGRVDVVCAVIDGTAARERTGSVLERARSLETARIVIAVNKRDLLGRNDLDSMTAWLADLSLGPVVAASARTGEGIEALRSALEAALSASISTAAADAITVTERQRTALSATADSLERAAELAGAAAETLDCADVVAFELREALDQLAAVTGAVTTDDLLGQVFARFCIGK